MRSSPQKKEEKEKVRQALLRASLHLAARHGFPSLGLREVARAAGIAPTSFYRHFADMEELGLALIGELVDPLLDGIAETAQATGEGGGDAAAALLEGLLAAAEQDPELVRFILTERYGASSTFRSALRQRLSQLAATVSPRQEQAKHERAAHATAMAVLLDACDQLLDAGADQAQDAQEIALKTLHLLLPPPTGEKRQ